MGSSAILPLLICFGAARAISFTAPPSDVTLTRNDIAVLPCELSEPVTCAWRLERTDLNSSGFLNTSPPPMLEPLSPLHPSDCSVRLAHPSTAYSGRYQCAPYTEEGKQILSGWATVHVVSDIPFACPPESGTFPDPDDCQYYYVCINGVSVRERCTPPLVFNPSLSICDYLTDVPECQ